MSELEQIKQAAFTYIAASNAVIDYLAKEAEQAEPAAKTAAVAAVDMAPLSAAIRKITSDPSVIKEAVARASTHTGAVTSLAGACEKVAALTATIRKLETEKNELLAGKQANAFGRVSAVPSAATDNQSLRTTPSDNGLAAAAAHFGLSVSV
jgi:hypothetical protein